MSRRRCFLALLIVLIATVSMAAASGEETFAKAQEIIESKVPCGQLTNDQLESIGDYYMEQMHPGEAHEAMDAMMGGEGSASLRQMHINMARSFYCGEDRAMGSGMMGRAMGSYGMMGSSNLQKGWGTMSMMGAGYGAMGAFGWFGMSLLWLLCIALAAFVFGIIFWWTQRLVMGNRKRR